MNRGPMVVLLMASAAGRLESQPTPPAGVAYAAGFQPGGQQLFLLDLNGTPVGEVPTTIKPLRGNVEVVLQGGMRMLKASSASEFLITLPQVLPQDFTLEFDLVPKTGGPPPDLSIEGTPTINQGVGSAHLLWQADGYLAVIGGAQDNYEQPMPEDLKATLPGVLTQVGVSVSGPTVKLYTNGRRLFTLDRVFARGRVLRVSLGGIDDGPGAVHLARLRIATGAPVLAGPPPPAPAPAPAPPPASQTSSQSQALTVGAPQPVSAVPNVAVTQGTAGPVVTWGLLAGVTTYMVKRWKINDAACCNQSSPALSGPPWQDGPLPVAGTYVFEVSASTPGGVATGQAQFVQFGTGGRIATATPAPAPAPAPVTMLPATQSGTITPITPPPPPAPVAGRTPGTTAGPVTTTNPVAAGSAATMAAPSPRTIPLTGFASSGGFNTAAPRTAALAGFTGVGTFSLPVPRTLKLPGFTGAGGLGAARPQTITLAGFAGTGSVSSRSTAPASRTLTLPGFTGAGGLGYAAPRTITLAGFSGLGSAVVAASRRIPLAGFTGSGGLGSISPRIIKLAGWTGTGAVTTP
jgi:hypothetical protein